MKINELRQFPLLQGLSKECLKSLAYYKKNCTYAINENIFDFGKPITKLVLLQSGQLLISVKKEEPRHSDLTIRFNSEYSHPLSCRKTSWIGLYWEAAILVPPTSVGEEYFDHSQPSYYRAKVRSHVCETLEFDFTDLRKCLNMNVADLWYFKSVSNAKKNHYRQPSPRLESDRAARPKSRSMPVQEELPLVSLRDQRMSKVKKAAKYIEQ